MDSAVAVVSSQIDYCNCLLYSVPKWHIDKLQRIQNAAARLVMQSKNLPYYLSAPSAALASCLIPF